jgi:hypothetical protein
MFEDGLKKKTTNRHMDDHLDTLVSDCSVIGQPHHFGKETLRRRDTNHIKSHQNHHVCFIEPGAVVNLDRFTVGGSYNL